MPQPPASKRFTGKTQKRAKKQPLPVQERLKRLFTSLCAQIDGGHFSNALKTCDKVLRLDPTDTDAQKTKLFLFLQTEQYDAALQLMDSADGHEFEKAYSLYRLQQEAEAQEAIKAVKEQRGDSDRGVAHLEAQLNYREGDYQTALDLYNELLDTVDPDSEEHSDILTNIQAAQKHLDFIGTGFLHALDALPTSIISSLEAAPPPVQAAAAASGPTTSAMAIASVQSQTVKPAKKVRLRRVPPGVVPGVTPPPDPERWLKKSERSSYNQGRRRKGGGGATQGASVDTTPHQPPSAHSTKSSGGKGKKKK